MATQETQYENFILNNPTSTITFDEWKKLWSEDIIKGIEKTSESIPNRIVVTANVRPSENDEYSIYIEELIKELLEETNEDTYIDFFGKTYKNLKLKYFETKINQVVYTLSYESYEDIPDED